jgi:hypothetical protein
MYHATVILERCVQNLLTVRVSRVGGAPPLSRSEAHFAVAQRIERDRISGGRSAGPAREFRGPPRWRCVKLEPQGWRSVGCCGKLGL